VVNAGGNYTTSSGANPFKIVGIVGTPSAIAAGVTPAGSISTLTVSGRTVSVTGQTVNVPKSVVGSLISQSTGTRYGPFACVVQGNSYSINFYNMATGTYALEIVLSNSGGSYTINDVVIVQPPGLVNSVITSQVASNLTYTVSGTFSGEVNTATATIPAVGGNAITMPSKAVTINRTNGTFTVSWDNVAPGQYGAPVVTFNNESGNKNATGGSAFTFTAPASTLTVTTCRFDYKTLRVQGTVNFNGDPNGTVTIYVDNIATNTTTTIPTTVTSGAWSYGVVWPIGEYRVRVVSSAWGETLTFTSPTNLKFMRLNGRPVTPT
jgi:hypothetical protein